MSDLDGEYIGADIRPGEKLPTLETAREKMEEPLQSDEDFKAELLKRKQVDIDMEYNSEENVLRIDLTKKKDGTPRKQTHLSDSIKSYIYKLMDKAAKDGFALIIKGLLPEKTRTPVSDNHGNDPWNLQNLKQRGKDIHHAKFQRFHVSNGERNGGFLYATLDVYFDYLEKRSAYMNSNPKPDNDKFHGSFSELDDEGNTKEPIEIRFTEDAIYAVDVDLKTNFHEVSCDFHERFLLPVILPGGKRTLNSSVSNFCKIRSTATIALCTHFLPLLLMVSIHPAACHVANLRTPHCLHLRPYPIH